MPNNRTTHGRSNDRIYNCYRGIKARCTNPKDPQWYLYGGRGIKVCRRWLASFENFLADMGEQPSNKHSIDRIDSNKGYNKANCRWATTKEQANNKRNNTVLIFNGEVHTIAQWAEILGISPKTISCRFNSGKPIEQVLSQQINYKEDKELEMKKKIVKKPVKNPRGHAVHIHMDLYNRLLAYAQREDKQLVKVIHRVLGEWANENNV